MRLKRLLESIAVSASNEKFKGRDLKSTCRLDLRWRRITAIVTAASKIKIDLRRAAHSCVASHRLFIVT
jgi:hypothetical protein